MSLDECFAFTRQNQKQNFLIEFPPLITYLFSSSKREYLKVSCSNSKTQDLKEANSNSKKNESKMSRSNSKTQGLKAQTCNSKTLDLNVSSSNTKFQDLKVSGSNLKAQSLTVSTSNSTVSDSAHVKLQVRSQFKKILKAQVTAVQCKSHESASKKSTSPLLPIKVSHSTPSISASKAFDLKKSLKTPLSWKAYKGPIKPLSSSTLLLSLSSVPQK